MYIYAVWTIFSHVTPNKCSRTNWHFQNIPCPKHSNYPTTRNNVYVKKLWYKFEVDMLIFKDKIGFGMMLQPPKTDIPLKMAKLLSVLHHGLGAQFSYRLFALIDPVGRDFQQLQRITLMSSLLIKAPSCCLVDAAGSHALW